MRVREHIFVRVDIFVRLDILVRVHKLVRVDIFVQVDKNIIPVELGLDFSARGSGERLVLLVKFS